MAETGEHSSDHDGFEAMMEFLREENPSVEFSMAGPNREAIQEVVDNIVADYRGDFTSVEAYVDDDYGDYGDGDYVRINASFYFDITVNLGWPGIVRQGSLLYPAVQAGHGQADDMFDGIPEESWTGMAAGFEEEIG